MNIKSTTNIPTSYISSDNLQKKERTLSEEDAKNIKEEESEDSSIHFGYDINNKAVRIYKNPKEEKSNKFILHTYYYHLNNYKS